MSASGMFSTAVVPSDQFAIGAQIRFTFMVYAMILSTIFLN